jgi:hypothetical protein
VNPKPTPHVVVMKPRKDPEQAREWTKRELREMLTKAMVNTAALST